MTTLRDLLEGNSLEMGAIDKTASAKDVPSNAINAEIDALANELGFDFSEKIAAEESDEKEKEVGSTKVIEDDKEEENEDNSATKEASMSIENLYTELYPEDADLNKTASEMYKEAADEAIGGRAFELSMERFDNRIMKIANNLGAVSKSSPGASSISESVNFPQELERDSEDNDDNAIGTDVSEGGVEVANAAERGAAASGDFKGDKLAMAMRKQMLMSLVD